MSYKFKAKAFHLAPDYLATCDQEDCVWPGTTAKTPEPARQHSSQTGHKVTLLVSRKTLYQQPKE